MSDNPKCPKCGTPIMKSLEGSLDTLIKGYIYCKGCNTRIEIKGDAPKKLNKGINSFKKTIKDVNRKLR